MKYLDYTTKKTKQFSSVVAKIKSSLKNPSRVCRHLFESLKGSHPTEPSVEMGAPIEDHCILFMQLLVRPILNIHFCCPTVTHKKNMVKQNQVCVDKHRKNQTRAVDAAQDAT